MEINSDRARTPLKFSITPEKPLFTFEAVGVRDFSKFTATFPPDLRPHTAINTGENSTSSRFSPRCTAPGSRSLCARTILRR
jgi:hypothetical protein